jgi:hypothetical protein
METDQELLRLDAELARLAKQVKAVKYRKKARLLELGREGRKAPEQAK